MTTQESMETYSIEWNEQKITAVEKLQSSTFKALTNLVELIGTHSRLMKKGKEKIIDIDDRLIDSEDTIDELEKLSLRTFETLKGIVDWMATTDRQIKELNSRVQEQDEYTYRIEMALKGMKDENS